MMSLLLREFDFNIKLGMATEDTEKFDEKLLLIFSKIILNDLCWFVYTIFMTYSTEISSIIRSILKIIINLR